MTNEEKEQMIISYQEHVNTLIDNYEKMASLLKKNEEDLLYSRDSDLEKSQFLKEIIRDVMTRKSRENSTRYFISPYWRRINERTRNYFALKEMLRRRSNQSTWSRLSECGLLSR